MVHCPNTFTTAAARYDAAISAARARSPARPGPSCSEAPPQEPGVKDTPRCAPERDPSRLAAAQTKPHTHTARTTSTERDIAFAATLIVTDIKASESDCARFGSVPDHFASESLNHFYGNRSRRYHLPKHV